MNAKLIGMVVALAFPLTVAAYSGEKGDHEQYRAKKIERLDKELKLSEDQKVKIEALFKEQGEKYKAIHEETESRLQKILTPEQNTQFKEMKQRRHEKWCEKNQERKQGKSESSQN
ncbi:hypothetical protein [Nitrosomonas sp. Nm58]|jgi:Spy/CpxP family protein refolding chaperone|uniref:hypothetical protein n=1 Tax=Nitrosomonas sp. Nm58 TaxID=200126 RepID=UPI00089C8EB7|nr:hypothetical protein [Nitrosomonas sp. Nm58]SDY04668.1 hypothetical protein SAMN05421754_1001170 [Nitrosomonas sp. Nm58]